MRSYFSFSDEDKQVEDPGLIGGVIGAGLGAATGLAAGAVGTAGLMAGGALAGGAAGAVIGGEKFFFSFVCAVHGMICGKLVNTSRNLLKKLSG